MSIRYLLERSLKFARIKAASLLETTGSGHYLNSIRVDVWCRWFLVKEAILAFPDRKRQAYASACAYVSLVTSFLSTKPENMTCYLINYREAMRATYSSHSSSGSSRIADSVKGVRCQPRISLPRPHVNIK